MYRIRRFRPADLGNVMQLVAEAIREPYREELYLNAYHNFPSGFLLVEDERGQLIAVTVAIPTPEYALRILILAVRAPYRGRGIGRMLVRQLTTLCLSYGLRKITLEVRVDNARAINFYERLGFVRTGIINNYYTDGSSGYVYEKYLY